MISLTLCLYLCSGLVIGLLVLFSAHNRKTGWKKSRATLSEAIEEFYADLGLAARVNDSSQVRPVGIGEACDASEFSLQLVNLRSALGDSQGDSLRVSPEHELVPASSR
jgi:hypothetical protein